MTQNNGGKPKLRLKPWPEWTEGAAMNAPNKPGKPYPRLVREVLWRSANGRWVVVAGPFPDLFPRTETRDTVDRAGKLLVQNIFARPATTREDTYAKVSISDILEVTGGKNEFGPISP